MIRYGRVELLILDLDNTLCDTLHTLTIRQWGKVADLFERRGKARLAEEFRRRAGKQSFAGFLKEKRLAEDETRIAIRAYDDNPVRDLRLFPDAHAILDLPIPKVLVTRGEPGLQRRKIRHLGIGKRFEDIVFIPTMTDKLSAMHDILERRGLRPSEALVIGDRIEEEIRDAKRLRIPCVLVRRPDWPVAKSRVKPDLTVRSLMTVARRLRHR